MLLSSLMFLLAKVKVLPVLDCPGRAPRFQCLEEQSLRQRGFSRYESGVFNISVLLAIGHAELPLAPGS
jgi:hypothetical protein